MDNAATEDAGKMNPNKPHQLTPVTSCLKEAMPRNSDAVVIAQLNGKKAE
jgi:hypothetical protein